MQRSKIILGLATACLAIAGAIAVKANNFGHSIGFYTISGSCINQGVETGCLYSATGTKTCRTNDAGIQTYYTEKNCSHIFKYNVQ